MGLVAFRRGVRLTSVAPAWRVDKQERSPDGTQRKAAKSGRVPRPDAPPPMAASRRSRTPQPRQRIREDFGRRLTRPPEMSPILRPPTIAAALSATISLLCMRRLTRPEVENEVKNRPAPISKRVEQTNLNIGVNIAAGFDGIAVLIEGNRRRGAAPSPIGRLHHVLDNDPAGGIAVPDIILHIEATLGQVGQRQAGDGSRAPGSRG